MTRTWPPDWRNTEDYPDPKATSSRMWAWEYIRRNKPYQQLCDKIGLDRFIKFREKLKKAANITDEELRHLINPKKRDAHNFYKTAVCRLFQYCPSFPLENNENNYYYDLLCGDFRLILPDHYSVNDSIIFFESDAVCFRRSSDNNFQRLQHRISKENKICDRIRFEYKRKNIFTNYDNYNDICEDIIFERDPGGKKHINYLRVHDANEKNEEIKEISKIVYGSISKISTTEKAYLSATAYINNRYIALAAPLFSPAK